MSIRAVITSKGGVHSKESASVVNISAINVSLLVTPPQLFFSFDFHSPGEHILLLNTHRSLSSYSNMLRTRTVSLDELLGPDVDDIHWLL